MQEQEKSIPTGAARMAELVSADAVVEKLCGGFQFTEGPIWDPREQCLYFSDMPGVMRLAKKIPGENGTVGVCNDKWGSTQRDAAGNEQAVPVQLGLRVPPLEPRRWCRGSAQPEQQVQWHDP